MIPQRYWILHLFIFCLVGAQTPPPGCPPDGFDGNLYKCNVGCGTVNVKAGSVIEVKSNNFDANGNYYNNEACTWTFKASDCDLNVVCPCFNIPNSFGCIDDYLKISYLKYHDRFCGDNPPVGKYRATSDYLTLRFRSDYKSTGKGFKCYVRCTKPGTADASIPDPMCPAGAKNPYVSDTEWN